MTSDIKDETSNKNLNYEVWLTDIDIIIQKKKNKVPVKENKQADQSQNASKNFPQKAEIWIMSSSRVCDFKILCWEGNRPCVGSGEPSKERFLPQHFGCCDQED